MKKLLTLLMAVIIVIGIISPITVSAAQVHNIDGNNYFKLRDVAQSLNNTPAQFNIIWDEELNTISLIRGQSYIPIENEIDEPALQEASPTTSTIYIDGKRTNLRAYNINGSNVFTLLDLSRALGVGIIWDDDAQNITTVEPPPIRTIFPRPFLTLPNRRATNEERIKWMEDYWAVGGPFIVELEVARLVSEERVAHGLNPLEIDFTLMMAARYYTQTQSDNNTINGHNQGPYRVGDEDTRHGASANVARAFGARLIHNGGNGATGQGTPESLVRAWMNSPGHRDYILHPEHRYIGTGSTAGGQMRVYHYMFLTPHPSN